MQKILITGGAGFIGSHLSETLLLAGHEVVCLDDFNDYYDPQSKRRNIAPLLSHKSYSLVEGDILNSELLNQIFQKSRINVIVHLAARAGVRPSIKEPLLYQKVNVEGTTNLLEAARKFGVEKFIFGSSSSVYGENKKVPFSENDPVDHPISPYAASKKAGELICYTYHHLYRLPVTCLRFFTVYGPRQRPDMAIHKFTKNIFEGQKVTMFGDGSSRRDYTFVDDIIDGITRSIAYCRGYHIYNLGESKTIALNELIQLIPHPLAKNPIIENLPEQARDVPITYADITKPRAETGYDPKIAIEAGIERFVKWYVETASS